MSITMQDNHPLGGLQARIDAATAATPDLFLDVVAQACLRHAIPQTEKRRRLGTLIEAGAWLDAALALIDLELPLWSVRRLVCDEGDWLCSLSREPNLPLPLDDTADAHHAVPALAVLAAFVEARMRTAPARSRVSALPATARASVLDNFI